MIGLETYNELFLKITMQGNERFFSKAGAWVGGSGDYTFEKVLLGPQGNPVQALMGQITRRITGENIPLMRVDSRNFAEGYFAWKGKHVCVIPLRQGESFYIESEDLLGFTSACNYSLHPLGVGVISQKGLFMSCLTAQVDTKIAVLVDGNPLVLRTPCCVDPDAMVGYQGADPQLKLNLSFKMLIGQTSGESYALNYTQPGGYVIVQPTERKSGLDLSMDSRNGNDATLQQNQTIGQAAGNVGDTLSGLGNMLNGGGTGGATGGGIGGMLGGLFR